MANINKVLGGRDERQFGYLHVDHRNSPGLPAEMARQAGYEPEHCREGRVFEMVTLGCVHCGSHVVMNPWRQRARARCSKCGNAYICDSCAAAMKAGCVHMTINEIVDKINTGRWILAGAMSRPVILPAPTQPSVF